MIVPINSTSWHVEPLTQLARSYCQTKENVVKVTEQLLKKLKKFFIKEKCLKKTSPQTYLLTTP
jgi:hypothetical protein